MSFMTCWAVVGLGLPDRFADGAASGNPQASIIALAAGLSGIPTATVSSPPLVAAGIMSDFGKIIVSGPGQYFSAIFSASSGISRTSGGSSLQRADMHYQRVVLGASLGLEYAADCGFVARVCG